ncbi:MAG: hypothetical protein COU35_00925 [Candidatus Magasanikbacteria bacterium CG10_big_fil_rev_8_21_14_0_10_47_10]|uniref:SUF system FeS cluster assembly SufBD core domain-containing protein n=1 Tax=Candidatus Magasanikbacteria bacterium CG10_big_fil_rev_8_21_14_0_10_47_10 TaxID=1974652 RepID=A0A2H0TRF4_9BACT|nr:MAG: hypothetical protein COU35_00925 [Candidatus Magasanikbacteria bacterium CG10_big_fil_rev_8_21_14_0_10_47_10]
MEQIVMHKGNASYTVKRNEILRLFDVHVGDEETIDSKVIVKLSEPGSSVELYSLFFGSADQTMQIEHLVEHAAPNTQSLIVAKGVLDDSAKAEYVGNIIITEGSHNVRAKQSEDVLLLSKNAKIDSVPHLEITNNAVECSHAVTTTNIDKEKLFYLQSRGIDKEQGIEISALAHIDAVLEKLDEDTREQILSQVRNKLYGNS